MERRNFLKLSIAGAMAGASGLLTWVPRANAETINKTFYITEGFITFITGENVFFK